jgi:sulfur-oxidizing protein SoxX
MKRQHIWALTAIACGLLAACAAPMPTNEALDQLTQKILNQSFRAEGQAGLERLEQDEDNRLCSQAQRTGIEIDAQAAKAIEERNFNAIRPPSDGQYIGDWKQGEVIAQDGRGKTWSDKADMENGGNCYNCHQISKEELSYGTLGPSLYNYGKLRGVRDIKSPDAKPIIEYTWNKIFNARAYNACSNMPRFGHKNILTETQIKHVMALLLDPASPVNQ